jgi:hypothetical protein
MATSSIPSRTFLCSVLFLTVLILFPSNAFAAGSVHGHAQLEKVKGRPDLGQYQLYEYKAFLCKDGNTSDCFSYHCGDPGTALHPYTGCFYFPSVPAGTYSLMSSFGKFFPRGKVTSSVTVINNQQTERDSNEPIDYSAYYSKSSWDSTGASTIYQTFIASGQSVSRVSFAKADSTSGGLIYVSIRDGSGGGNVQNWPLVGTERSCTRGGYGADHWVSWHRGEVQLTPGETYAVKLRDQYSRAIQPYWCNDSYYANGTGYRGSQSSPANHDYYIAVFADNDNTCATVLPRSSGLNNLMGWKDGWAQSFKAKGTSFAGAALFGTDGNWEFTATCSVHANSPNGTQIGPTKTVPSVYGVSSCGVAGVCFSRGEVETTPGNTYWIVYQVSGGFNVYRMNEGNGYSDGTSAYKQGSSWINTSNDLYISIYEYTEPPEPGENLLVNPGAETGDFTGWTTGGSPGGQPLIDPSTHVPSPANHSGSHRFGMSVGWSTANCYQYQSIVVQAGHTYSASLWACHKDGTDEHVEMAWIDGSWPGTELELYDIGPSNPGTTWVEYSGESFQPSGTTATIVLRYRHDYATNIASIHVDDVEVRDITAAPTATPVPPTATPVPPTATPQPSQVTVDDYFNSQTEFDANWTAYGTSPARYIKNEYWCSHTAQYVEIQSSNGGYYRTFDDGFVGGAYTLTMDTVRGYSARYIRVDSNGGTNPSVYDKSWNSAGGNWTCEYPSAIQGYVGSSGKITVFLGTTNNGQYEHLRIVFDPPAGPTPTPLPATPTPPCGRDVESLGSLTNMSFQTSWPYTPVPQDPSGWFVLQWGANAGPQYYTGSELSSGKPSNHRCKYEIGGSGTEHVLGKEIYWGSATSVDFSAYCAGRKWDGSSTGTMSIGVDLDGCANSWSDADETTGVTKNDEVWRQLSLTDLDKPQGATSFTIMLRANRSGTSWNCQFDEVSVTD